MTSIAIQSLYSTDYTTTNVPRRQPSHEFSSMHSPLARDTPGQLSDCPGCGSQDSFARGHCQICGHVKETRPYTARTHSAHTYSYSSRGSYSGRASSSYSSAGYSTKYSQSSRKSTCPECSACDSINQGCCEVCGHTVSTRDAKRPGQVCLSQMSGSGSSCHNYHDRPRNMSKRARKQGWWWVECKKVWKGWRGIVLAHAWSKTATSFEMFVDAGTTAMGALRASETKAGSLVCYVRAQNQVQ